MARVRWRGALVDDRTRDMLDEVARLTPKIPTLWPTQGSYSTAVGASAGTHAGGGAVDLSVKNLTTAQSLETIRVMRTVGFAAWLRLPHEGPWPEHIHAIAVGCPDMSPAAARQVDALRAGRNGLANNGLDPHRGMRLPVVTWEQYLARKVRDVKPTDLRTALFGDSRTWQNTPVKATADIVGADSDRNVAWILRYLMRNVAAIRRTVDELAAGQAEASADRAAQRELLVRLTARETGVPLSDEQVAELGAAIAAAGQSTCDVILERLELTGAALTGDE